MAEKEGSAPALPSAGEGSPGSRDASGTLQAVAYFALLTFLFFAPVWLTGRAYVPSDFLYRTPLWYEPRVELQNFDLFDTTIFFYPDYDYLNKSLHRGEFPFWNPYNLCGRPVAFNGQSGYFYPPRLLLHRVMSTTAASTTLLAIHIFVSGLAMYWLGKSLGLSHPGALLSGTAWMFNGWSTTWFTMEHAPIFSALLPLGLIALRRACLCWRGSGWLAAVVAMTLVAGTLQLTYYTWAIMLLLGSYFVLVLGRRSWPGSLLRIGCGFVLGALLAAPMLLPTVIHMTASQRPTLTLDFLLTTYRQALLTGIPTVLFPDAYGNPADDFALVRVTTGGYYIYPELCCYVGVASLLLAGCCLWQRGFPRYLGGLALTCLLVPATPLYGLVYWLPGLDRINSTRLVFVWMFFVALGAGFGLDSLNQTYRRWLTRVAGLAMLVWVGVLAYLNSGTPALTVVDWLNARRVRLPEAQLYLSKEEHLRATIEGFQATYGWTSWAALAPLAWLGLFVLALSWRRYAPQALLALLAADLLSFGVRFNPKMIPSSVYPETPTIRFLQEKTQWERVMGVGTIRPNTLMPFELYDVGGYDAFYPYSTGLYFNYLMGGEAGLEGPMSPQVFPLTRTDSTLVNLLGARYFVSYPGQSISGCVQVADAPLPVFENPNHLPRAFLVSDYEVLSDLPATLRRLASPEFDPRRSVVLGQDPGGGGGAAQGRVEIVSYRPHEVRLRLEGLSGPCFLVLTDAFSAGWTAQADGRATPIYRANGMFRAVGLQGQEQEVVFRYQPPGWDQGLALFGLALLAVLGLLLAPSRVRRAGGQDSGAAKGQEGSSR